MFPLFPVPESSVEVANLATWMVRLDLLQEYWDLVMAPRQMDGLANMDVQVKNGRQVDKSGEKPPLQ